MRLTILGSGTSIGVPVVGCQCEVCRSTDAHDKRLRTSALVHTDDGKVILIDCGPDFREQGLRLNSFEKIDGVLITHQHYDHVSGLDDLRPYGVFGDIPIYAEEWVAKDLRTRMPYALIEHVYPGRPRIYIDEIEPFKHFYIGTSDIIPVRVMHGQLPILGYVIGGKLGYITDMLTMPQESFEALKGVEVLVVNALRRKEHPTHQSLDQAIEVAKQIGARYTFFTHISHDLGLHHIIDQGLPRGMALAYDGMDLTF